MKKWLTKMITSMFKKQTEEITENYGDNHPRLYEKRPVEAKVTYQYPKGNFRFPVIPDDNTVEKVTSFVPNNKKNKYNNVSEIRPQGRTIEEAKRFKPTNIPSPIYGFSHRKNNSENHDVGNAMDNYDAAYIEVNPRNEDHPRAEQSNELKSVGEDDVQQPIVDIETDNEKEKEVENDVESDQELLAVHQFENKRTTKTDMLNNCLKETFEIDHEMTANKMINTDNEMVTDNMIGHGNEADTNKLINDDNENENEMTDNRVIVDDNEITSHEEESLTESVDIVEKTHIHQEKDTHDPKAFNNVEKEGSVPYNVMMYNSDKQKLAQVGAYRFPPLHLLVNPSSPVDDDEHWLNSQKEILDMTLKNFNVNAKVVKVTKGPAVTQFEVHPQPGVKVNKITNLSDDIKLSLAAKDIRIEAPIPGKNTIGIEVPNLHSKPVTIKNIIGSSTFLKNSSVLAVALGVNISGEPVVTDLKKMPHGLIAGATGSGKSVCINAILISLLYKAAPEDVKLLLVDPKMVELAPYNGIPHLVTPVVTDVKAATAALKWAVSEMERRYEIFAHERVRDIDRYNEKVKKGDINDSRLPYIVIIIDELADLMMVSPQDVEDAVCRIAQKARACGIHLLLATQRPSVDVITGLIKANIPTRIAFSVSSQIDSRTIIDTNGAEKLLGKGDMLFLENGSSKPNRVQGNFVSDEEIDRVTSFVKNDRETSYLFEQAELIQSTTIVEEDELFPAACEFVYEQGAASSSSLQRRFRIGFNRAARLIELMEERGIVSEARGSKPRGVLISNEDLQVLLESSTNLIRHSRS